MASLIGPVRLVNINVLFLYLLMNLHQRSRKELVIRGRRGFAACKTGGELFGDLEDESDGERFCGEGLVGLDRRRGYEQLITFVFMSDANAVADWVVY